MSGRGRDFGRGEHVPDDEELRALLGDEIAGEFEELGVDGHGVLRRLSDPQRPRHPRPQRPPLVHVLDVPDCQGKRLVVARADQDRYNFRAASDVFEDTEGQWVKVVEEWRWFAYLAMPEEDRPPSCPRAWTLSPVNVWVDTTS